MELGELGELIAVVGKRWPILAKLKEGEFYVAQLATVLDKKKPDMSNYLSELERAGLVSSKLVGGRKYFALTRQGLRIVEALSQSVQETKLVMRELDPGAVSLVLRGAGDPGIKNDTVKERLAQGFLYLCDRGIWRYDEVKQLFVRIVQHPGSFDSDAGKRYRDGMRSAVRRMLDDGSERLWVVRELYPGILRNAQDRDLPDTLRGFFLGVLGVFIIPCPEKRGEILEVCKDALFGGGLGESGKEQAREIFCEFLKPELSEYRDGLFDYLLEQANGDDPGAREMAERLVGAFIDAAAR